MAAGNAERFGENKLLRDIGGRPLFSYGLDVMRALVSERGDCSLTVVTQYAEIAGYCAGHGVRCVINPDSRFGASYTIRAGIRAVMPEKGDFLVFAAADQPYIRKETVQKLLDAASTDAEAARVFYGEIPGNPVLFSASLVPELNALTGDDGGRSILKKHECIRVQADSRDELKDIDRPDDI